MKIKIQNVCSRIPWYRVYTEAKYFGKYSVMFLGGGRGSLLMGLEVLPVLLIDIFKSYLSV